MTDTFDDIQQSYGRCLRDKRFIERFYEIFLASHPSIAPAFAHTDFNKQRLALRRGISVAISHAGGSGMVKRTITEIASMHARTGRCPVQPDLYRYWLDSLVQAVREKDPEVTDALILRWREAMGVVVKTFTSIY